MPAPAAYACSWRRAQRREVATWGKGPCVVTLGMGKLRSPEVRHPSVAERFGELACPFGRSVHRVCRAPCAAYLQRPCAQRLASPPRYPQVNVQGERGMAPLHVAVWDGNTAAVASLLAAKVSGGGAAWYGAVQGWSDVE